MICSLQIKQMAAGDQSGDSEQEGVENHDAKLSVDIQGVNIIEKFSVN